MGYYCNECKKTISSEEFYFSMNRYKKALCSDHQRRQRMSGPTKDLQELVRKRHQDELQSEVPQLKTIKDWIKADLGTWDKVIKNESDGHFVVTVSSEELKNKSLKRNKK
jgi:hypothetical protein